MFTHLPETLPAWTQVENIFDLMIKNCPHGTWNVTASGWQYFESFILDKSNITSYLDWYTLFLFINIPCVGDPLPLNWDFLLLEEK